MSSKETHMFLKFSSTGKDDRLKEWWNKLSAPASEGLRKAINFYLDFKKYGAMLKLLSALKITPEVAEDIIRRNSHRGVQTQKTEGEGSKPTNSSSSRIKIETTAQPVPKPTPKSNNANPIGQTSKVRKLLDD